MTAKSDPHNDDDRACLAAALTACALGATPEAILSPKRGPSDRGAVAPCRHLPRVSRFARAFGQNRSSIACACRLIEDKRDDPDFVVLTEAVGRGPVDLSSVLLLSEAPAVA